MHFAVCYFIFPVKIQLPDLTFQEYPLHCIIPFSRRMNWKTDWLAVQNLPVLIGRLIPTYHHSRGKFWFDLKYKTFRVRLFFKANVGNDGCLKLIAENQNNFDNSNNSLVCFKAPDTFPRSVTFLWEYLRRTVSKLSFYLKYPETTKYFTTSLWKSVADGFDGIELNVCENIEAASRIRDQLATCLMAESGTSAFDKNLINLHCKCFFLVILCFLITLKMSKVWLIVSKGK